MENPVFSEKETQLMDYVNILLKKKWIIIIPTLLLVLIIGIYSFFLPKAWAIDTIILPSKFFYQTELGELREIYVVQPEQISNQINGETYNNIIANELNLNIREFPKLKAENIRNTKLVRISTRSNDIEQAKLILHSLFNHIKSELDKKIEVEIIGLDTQVESKKNAIKSKAIEISDKEKAIELERLYIEDRRNEIKTYQNRIKDEENLIKIKENEIKLRKNQIKSKNLDIESKEIEKINIKEEINTLKNKLKISEEREMSITEEMSEVKNRIDKIDEELKNVLKNGANKNSLSILLYSNEIQNNLRYYNTLDERLSNEKINQENINLTIKERLGETKKIDNQIEQIKTQNDDIETKIDDINTEIENVKTRIEDINTQINNVKNEIEKINNRIATIKNEIRIKNNEISNIKNDISYLEGRKARIDYTQLIKEPTSSLYPVFPKKKLIILVTGILSLLIFSILALSLEYIEKFKVKSS